MTNDVDYWCRQLCQATHSKSGLWSVNYTLPYDQGGKLAEVPLSSGT